MPTTPAAPLGADASARVRATETKREQAQAALLNSTDNGLTDGQPKPWRGPWSGPDAGGGR